MTCKESKVINKSKQNRRYIFYVHGNFLENSSLRSIKMRHSIQNETIKFKFSFSALPVQWQLISRVCTRFLSLFHWKSKPFNRCNKQSICIECLCWIVLKRNETKRNNKKSFSALHCAVWAQSTVCTFPSHALALWTKQRQQYMPHSKHKHSSEWCSCLFICVCACLCRIDTSNSSVLCWKLVLVISFLRIHSEMVFKPNKQIKLNYRKA